MLIEHHKIPEDFAEHAFLAGDLFGNLSRAATDSLLAVKDEKKFAENETIFLNGQSPAGIYILAEGEALVLHHGVEPVHLIKPGEILGLPETLANLPSRVVVRTVSACRFEFIRREAFLDFLRVEPDTCFHLLRMLGTNLQKLYEFLY